MIMIASWLLAPMMLDIADQVASPDIAIPASPATDIVDWFPQDAYPVAALRARLEGRVQIRVDVDPAGKIYACKIVSSSGSDALDTKTCELAVARGSFVPARNADGVPVRSEFTLPFVRWGMFGGRSYSIDQLPEPPRGVKVWLARDYARELSSGGVWFRKGDYPKNAKRLGLVGNVAVRVTIGIDGLPTSCWIVESSGVPELDDATCSIVLRRGSGKPARDVSGRPIISAITLPLVRWTLDK